VTLTIWGRLSSHNAKKVVWLAGEMFPWGSTPSAGSPRAYRAPIYPHMSHWYARLRGRPGYAPHVMIPLT